MGSRGPALHGRVQAFVYAGMQEKRMRPDARSRASPSARVARDAGCTPTSVYQWMRRYRSEGILGLMDRRNAPMPAEPMPAAGDDVEELRRQVEVLRLENAVMRETIGVLKADDCVGGGAVFLGL